MRFPQHVQTKVEDVYAGANHRNIWNGNCSALLFLYDGWQRIRRRLMEKMVAATVIIESNYRNDHQLMISAKN